MEKKKSGTALPKAQFVRIRWNEVANCVKVDKIQENVLYYSIPLSPRIITSYPSYLAVSKKGITFITS